jgi:hypothetical protein
MNLAFLVIAFGFLQVTSPSPKLSPDGNFYLNRPNVNPYVLRSLYRWIKFENPLRYWTIINQSAVLATSLLLELHQFGAGFLFLGLASTRTNMIFPILTDQLGILFLTLGFLIHPIFFILGGFINEKVPLIGALINPLAILGIIFPIAMRLKYEEKLLPSDPDWLREPLKAGIVKLRTTNPVDLILPWGVASVGLFLISPFLVLFAYLQLLLAQDRARIYQWISPIVCVAAAGIVPIEWMAPLIVLHFLNPWRQII